MNGEKNMTPSQENTERTGWEDLEDMEKTEGGSMANKNDLVESLATTGSKEMFEREGVKLKATFFAQKQYGRPLEEVSSDEFNKIAGNAGYLDPEKSGHNFQEFIKELQHEKVYQVKNFTMSKGNFTLPDDFTCLSQPFSNWVIRHRGGPVRWKAVFSRLDEKEGGLLFSDGDEFERF